MGILSSLLTFLPLLKKIEGGEKGVLIKIETPMTWTMSCN